MDGVNLSHKTAKELEHGRNQKNNRKMMCETLRQPAAPEQEIDIFNGNLMDFHYFMAVLKEVVENMVTEDG